MTQTPSRDWQKDMEMCDAQEGDEWCNYGKRLEEYDRLTEEGCRPIAEFEREEEAAFTAECREALPYWLQEAKELQEIASGRGREYLKMRQLLKESERREQKLKEAYERTLESIYTQHCTMNHMENTEHEKGQISGLIKASNILKQSFSTLYPDTPAPTGEEGDNQ